MNPVNLVKKNTFEKLSENVEVGIKEELKNKYLSASI